jgi:hypothetical protein
MKLTREESEKGEEKGDETHVCFCGRTVCVCVKWRRVQQKKERVESDRRVLWIRSQVCVRSMVTDLIFFLRNLGDLYT